MNDKILTMRSRQLPKECCGGAVRSMVAAVVFVEAKDEAVRSGGKLISVAKGSEMFAANVLRSWLFACFLASVLLPPAHAQFSLTYESNIGVKMRDGVTLRADIYRPNVPGKFPVLLERTPYNKYGGAGFALKAAAEGYVVIVQDVRGRFASEGEWYPLKNEPNDGYDTVEWAAGLPYSDGRVGMFGGSYVGATQMLAAIAHPPHLAGICPSITQSNYHEDLFYTGGAFAQWVSQSWTSQLAQDSYERFVSSRSNPLEGLWKPPEEYVILDREQRLSLASTATIAPYYLDWLAHPNYDDYWKRLSIAEHFSDITVPALHIAAWYDAFLGGSLNNYEGIRDHGGSDVARNGQHLIVMIGGHAGIGPKVGDVDFGPNTQENVDGWTLQWYDYLFKGAKNQFASHSHVRIFVMGSDEWRDEDDWPISRAKSVKYFLHSDGKANSVRGKGALSTVSPAAEASDQFAYDPASPVPTVGGPLCCDYREPAGPRDQRAVEARDDVLVYSTPPMTEDVDLTGPVSLQLYAKSSAIDTDFTAKLIDVWPNGFAQDLTEGILRARYRDSREKPELMNPGQIYRFTIDMWATSNVFKKGHVLRLEVSSSNFPRFDRNLNTGVPQYVKSSDSGARYVTATNVILHDAEHPSALVLPVVAPR